jgi:hypothetical protein
VRRSTAGAGRFRTRRFRFRRSIHGRLAPPPATSEA